MAKKEFTYRGKTVEELKAMPPEEFLGLLNSRERRRLKRGYSKPCQKFIDKLYKATPQKPARTHNRTIVVTPRMFGHPVAIYNGKEFVRIDLEAPMVGYRLGDLVMTRKRVRHSSPGMGATRSSRFVALR